MKVIVILMMGLLFVACNDVSSQDTGRIVDGKYVIYRYYDKDNNVVCYSYNGGLSCLKLGGK